MIPLKDLTQKEKNTIAEFLFSYETDVLIRSDAIAVIEMFKKRNINVSNIKLETYSVLFLIKTHVGILDRQEIMKQYYNGKI